MEKIRLDMSKVSCRINNNISSLDALKDVTPFEFPDEVLNGEQKITITQIDTTNANKIGDTNLCVKLETLS